jgi:predicted RNA binding protein YcfA (HicA-like mRNA interferase family)
MKPPQLKPIQVEKILLRHGFEVKRQTGSHRIFIQPQTKKSTSLPMHNKDVPSGTLRSIIKQTSIPEEEFRK